MKHFGVILTIMLALGLPARAQKLSDYHTLSERQADSLRMDQAEQMKERKAEEKAEAKAQKAEAREQRRMLWRQEEEYLLTHRDSVRLYRRPDAMRAVWMGAIIPGYGQIYNRSYWKLPIVYGGFVGCAFAITYTGGNYSDYKTAYRDIYTDINAGAVSEEAGKSYIDILPEGYTLSYVGGASKWMTTLQSRQNTWRRYRDYCIVATIAVYALSLIDAYVDAQLFDFDISPNLSMTLQPAIYQDYRNQTAAEMNIAIKF